MISKPTREQLGVLNTTERVAFELADLTLRHLRPVSERWNSAFMGLTIWGAGGRRMDVRGLDEHLGGYDRQSRVLLVANHRSFFDFYVITALVYWRTKMTRRVLCPVRSTFFYDHPLGPAVNMVMSGMSMFPPILRDPKRGTFNRYSLERCVSELETPGTTMGLHPEGTRNKGDDPYSFLPAQPGVGKIALDAKHAHVHPVFIHGLSNSLPEEFRRNWLRPIDEHPVDISFGPEIDLEDLRAQGSRPANTKRAADRMLLGIKKLSEQQRAMRTALDAKR